MEIVGNHGELLSSFVSICKMTESSCKKRELPDKKELSQNEGAEYSLKMLKPTSKL